MELKIMIFNVGDNKIKAEEKKPMIQTVIDEAKPDIVLFQEFKLGDIHGKSLKKHPIPDQSLDQDLYTGHNEASIHPIPDQSLDQYLYTGHKEASILYNKEKIGAKDLLKKSEVYLIAERIWDNEFWDNKLLNKIDPVSRMCIKQVTTTPTSAMHFIIISWHGPHSGFSPEKKIGYFKCLMEFVKYIKDKYQLPVLIAGDFNVDVPIIRKYVHPPFHCKFKVIAEKHDIDYFIISEELTAEDIHQFDLVTMKPFWTKITEVKSLQQLQQQLQQLQQQLNDLIGKINQLINDMDIKISKVKKRIRKV